MKPEVKERVYLLVIIFCVFMCGAMIVTMLTGGTPDDSQEHAPVMREIVIPEQNEEVGLSESNSDEPLNSGNDNTESNKDNKNDNAAHDSITGDSETSADNSQLAITEDFINEKLEDFLPSGFPLKNPIIDIDADGIITIKGKAVRDELKQLFEDSDNQLGIKYSIALLLLPAEFNVEAALSVAEGQGRMLDIKSHSLIISGKEIPADAFPQKITDIISDVVNGAVDEWGEMLRFSGFEDGAILFERI